MKTPTPAIMRELRSMMPFHPLTLQEAMTIAEAQATVLLHLLDITEPAVDIDQLVSLPRIAVQADSDLADHDFASSSSWQKGRWIIRINPKHTLGKQRFAVAHELKHILDARAAQHAYRDLAATTEQRHEYIEYLADHFAASVLIPQAWVIRAIHRGYRGVRQLAMLFMVPPTVMHTRLKLLGITFDRSATSGTTHDDKSK